MELYNEELTDLLSVADTKLKLMEGRNGVQVHGIEEVIVQNSTEIFSLLDRGSSKRRTAETLLNKVSSRSHSIFTIIIHMKESTPEGHEVIKIGKLNLVDLAGSENISRSGKSCPGCACNHTNWSDAGMIRLELNRGEGRTREGSRKYQPELAHIGASHQRAG